MHFADGELPGDALERALRQEMESWTLRRPAPWADLLARAEGKQASSRALRRILLAASVGGAAVVAAGAVALAAAGHPLPPGLEQVRERLVP